MKRKTFAKTMRPRKILYGSLAAFAILISIFLLIPTIAENDQAVRISISGSEFVFELADTPEARSKGLMHRRELAPDSGMLFAYPSERRLFFYMKNTYIPLSIAFINANLRIIDIQKMRPLDETIIRSRGKARYALEVNQGFFERHGVSVGDRIHFVSGRP